MKKCFKCGIEKELTEFYAHPKTADKHLNKCKDCTKIDVAERALILQDDNNWVEKEKERNREKYYRLGYRVTMKPSFGSKKSATANYIKKYPEKRFATIASQKITTPEGMEKHHWSYRKESVKDVIFLSTKEHNIAHRFMVYDQKEMYYRTNDGRLLDTKEAHLGHIIRCIHSEQGKAPSQLLF